LLDIVIAIIGGRLFWHPIIWAGVIPITFMILLWIAGGKIKKHLDKNYSVLMTSFLFTFFVNTWLFGLFLVIFIVGGLFFNPLQSDGFSGISSVETNIEINKVIIKSGCLTSGTSCQPTVTTQLDDARVIINLLIDYDIYCVSCTP
jgi:hypothetical protein